MNYKAKNTALGIRVLILFLLVKFTYAIAATKENGNQSTMFTKKPMGYIKQALYYPPVKN